MYKKMIKYKIIIFSILAIGFFSIMGIIYGTFSSAPQKNSELENFIVKRNSTQDQVINTLKTSGFIKNQQAFDILIDLKGGLSKIKPGGYKISKSMNAWSIANILTQKPYMEWVVIPEGLRKEEIAEILGQALDWNDANKKDWIETATDQKPEYFEGVYFPDTYLISVDEPPLQIAERLRAKFQEEFSPLAKEAIKQNIKWDTALKIASIVQRESAGKNDMPIIAGIIWNRLLQNMKLDIDATLQYARGNTGQGWWAPISIAEKQIDSPYNTYKYKGLPPHPICNPGLDAINAVLSPSKTDCLYYLHDSSKVIHCTKTYEEHRQNIAKFLK